MRIVDLTIEGPDNLGKVIILDIKEILIETYRHAGSESAVRMTYLPKGVFVECDTHLSQHLNREECYRLLAKKLIEEDD